DIFESVSLVEAALRDDPGGVYVNSDFATRDDCRHVVEQVARHSGRSELEVAQCAVQLAQQSPGSHLAYFLLSAGIKELEGEMRAEPPLQTRFSRAIRRHATPVYLGAIGTLTACFLALTIALAWEAGANRWSLIALGALAYFPLSELVIQI